MGESSVFCRLLDEGKEKEAKLALRGTTESGASLEQQREANWRKILQVRTAGAQFSSSSLYWDTVQTCYGTTTLSNVSSSRLPGCVDTNHCPSYGLDQTGKATVARLVTVLAYNSPDVPFIPLLYPITSVLLKQNICEEDCYSYITMLVAPPSSQNISYFTQSKSGWDILCFALKPLAQKYVKGSVSFLESEFGQEASDEFFQSWPWWIFENLELKFLSRVMDCYLYEGHKVLFRTALALLKLFHKAVLDKKGDWYNSTKKDGIHKTFASYCTKLNISPEDLLKTAFKIPRFSRSDIQKLAVKLEMEAKANKLHRVGRRTKSNEELSVDGGPDDRANTQSFSTPQHRPSGTYPIHHLVSELLSKDQLMSIWDELPERIASVKPTLAYSSNEHGVSLTTFFNRVDKYEPTIMVIRTTNKEVFGAYCSTSWGQRNQKNDKGMRMRYFGTGETFLFKFKEGSSFAKYEWVKKEESDSDDDDENQKKVTKDRAKELFMSGDNTMVTIGGGGGTAIYLDENLRFGQTEKCETFENDLLCSDRDFTVNIIELFGFNDISW
eukprot:GFUD01041228.1.p1 GENE.GFUD01041228.1~~GFUD01041228.1.p1  ORF type:complete len:554 (-),score=152.51 GFUD01041228.1:339-2000(-)